jgi:hemolysin activation/secretion protein
VVRRYDIAADNTIQSELVADSGFTVSGEYRHQVWQSKSRRDSVQAVGFVDHGYGELKRPQAGEDPHRSLTGAGVGLRANSGLYSSLRLDLGMPLSSGRNVDGDDVLLYVQAATRY